MNLIQLPKYLYKFVTWEKEYHKDILRKNTIYFPSADKFNDPFDSTVPLRYDSGSPEQIIELYIQHLHKENPTLSYSHISELAKKYYENNRLNKPDAISQNIKFQNEWAKTKYGIFVLTTEAHNILMWSHYSNSHTGICIRFDMEKFRNFIELDCIKRNQIIIWDKVSYENEYPILNPFELDDNEVIVKPLMVKSADWQYENEYRFILFDEPNTPLQLESGIIDQVICGCKIDANDKNDIIQIAGQNSISVLQSKLKDNYFGIEFESIN